MNRLVLSATCLVVSSLGSFATDGHALTTDAIFEQHSPAVTQVRIVNRASSSKVSLGSAFFVSSTGLLITNYHVISELVHHPKKYSAELVDGSGTTTGLELLNIDVVHDLAILQAATPPPALLALATDSPRHGTRLFSLGNPFDLGTSIVEGTYNGMLEGSLYEKIHFTGAINPGMSGGPTLDRKGRVVGVNVATAGNALSFLVPAKFAAALLAATTSDDFSKPESFTELLRTQLLKNQQLLADRLFENEFDSVSLGRFRLPSRLATFMKCWGDETTTPEVPYRTVTHACTSNDSIYVADQLSSGLIDFDHRWYTTDSLNRFQFYSMYEEQFGATHVGGLARGMLTRFECNADFVDHSGIDLKVVLCLRAYKKLPGLYDAILMAASLDSNDSGLQTKLEMRGVSFGNAHRLARKYMEAITWTQPSS